MPPAATSRTVAHFRRERALIRSGVWPVAGVDEAGRGPLAGPVCAAAVILDSERLPRGVTDSKLLSPAERAEAYDLIMSRAIAIAIAFAPAVEIDRINIRQATFVAMCRALHGLAIRPAHALVDGSDMPPGFFCPGETIVRGDSSSMSIAAASIVAKVTRDRLMSRLDGVYPGYGFGSHMGYATKAHLAAIRIHGQCAIHRSSFSPFRQPELPL